MSNEPEDFRAWLLRLVDERSAIGDLARDVRDDDEWPDDEPESLELYQDYLESRGAIDRALDTLEAAWGHYSREAGIDA